MRPGRKNTLVLGLDEIIDQIKPFREHRNKRIAHHAIAEAEPPGFSCVTIENALSRIRDFMNMINNQCRSASTGYEDTVLIGGGGDAMVGVLELASRFHEIQKQACKPGASADDIFETVKRRMIIEHRG